MSEDPAIVDFQSIPNPVAVANAGIGALVGIVHDSAAIESAAVAAFIVTLRISPASRFCSHLIFLFLS